MIRVNLTGQLDGLLRGLNLLLPELPMELCEDGIPVEVVKGDCLRVDWMLMADALNMRKKCNFTARFPCFARKPGKAGCTAPNGLALTKLA